eukprot:gene1366-11988_t
MKRVKTKFTASNASTPFPKDEINIQVDSLDTSSAEITTESEDNFLSGDGNYVNKNEEIKTSEQNMLILIWIFRTLSFMFLIILIINLYKETFFKFHPILMSISFLLLLSEGLFQVKEMKTNIEDRNYHQIIHVVIQFVSLISSLISFYVAFKQKNYLLKNHFTSWHSWFGVLTLTLQFLVSLIGMFKFFNLFHTFYQTMKLRISHQFLGILCYFLGLITMLFGFQSDYISQKINNVVVYLMGSFVFFVMIFMVNFSIKFGIISLFRAQNLMYQGVIRGELLNDYDVEILIEDQNENRERGFFKTVFRKIKSIFD